MLVLLKEWPEAKTQLEKAIALGPVELQAHFELAKALRALGETEGAQAESQRYLELKRIEEDRLEAASKAAQGDKDMSAGKIQEAITQYRAACEREPGDGGYKYQLSIALHQAGDIEGERTQLEEAVHRDPRLAGAQKQLGYLLARDGDAAGAVEHFQMAVRAAPGWVEAWINLSAELAVEGRFSDAREAVAIALRLDANNTQARKLNDHLTQDSAAQHSQP